MDDSRDAHDGRESRADRDRRGEPNGDGLRDGHPIELDHLVVAAATLVEGVAWCARTLGIVPDAGGAHPFMGTHNRIFAIATARFPKAYFETIAIDPAAAAPPRARWFGLDEPALQRALAAGPRLIQWVARCTDIGAASRALRERGCDPGPAEAAERATPHGPLRWRITLRADGRRLGGGAVPVLIEWDGRHPSQSLPDSGVALTGVTLGGLDASFGTLLGPNIAVASAGARRARHAVADAGAGRARYADAGAGSVASGSSAAAPPAPLQIALETPRGVVTLESIRLED
ncbi:MAG: VOC family protein [Caldimonas sp.]